MKQVTREGMTAECPGNDEALFGTHIKEALEGFKNALKRGST